MICLSDEELHEWSGYQQPSKQILWLKRHGIRFSVAANGHPRVLRIDVEKPMERPSRKPNFEALKRLG